MIKRAGSAIVVEKPIKNPKIIIRAYHFFAAKLSVSFFPTGNIPYSSHSRKRASPIHTKIIPPVIARKFSGAF